MLGQKTVQELSAHFSIVGLNRTKDSSLMLSESISLNINDFELIRDVLRRLNPSVIIHTAAIVDVEYCEYNKEACSLTNFYAVKNIVDNLEKDTLLIFISTESVFDNTSQAPTEESKKNPPNHYCKTKSDSEDYIISNHSNHIILRTNMYGFHKNWRGSLVEWAINKLQRGERIGGYTDVVFNPLYTGQIAKAILELIKINFKGIIHLGSNLVLSKLEFTTRLAKALNLNEGLVYKSSIESGSFVKRNKYAVLDITKAESIISMKNLDFNLGFDNLIEDLKDRYEKNNNWYI